MRRYKHIIFDFGGVLIRLGKRLAHHGYSMQVADVFDIPVKQAKALINSHMHDLLIEKETPLEFLEFARTEIGSEMSAREAYKKWVKILPQSKSRIDWGMVRLVEELGKSYKVHMLTDSIDIGGTLREQIKGRFANVFKSFEIGVTKRNRKAFVHVLKKIRAKPGECLFIDDSQRHIDVARKVGIDSILYTNLPKLKKELAKRGIN